MQAIISILKTDDLKRGVNLNNFLQKRDALV